MNQIPKKPYTRECDRCGSHDIRVMHKDKGEVDYEYCGLCKHQGHFGSFLIGPGIPDSMAPCWKLKIYEQYFGDCCTVCGGEDTKVCGYTDQGRGIPFRLCKTCRHPENIQISKITYEVKPMDEDWFNRAEIAKEHERQKIEKKKNIKKMGVKRPDMNKQTGKTQRNRERKKARGI